MRELLDRLEEAKTENQKRAEFKKRYPYFDMLLKASDSYDRVKDYIPVSSKKKSGGARLSTYEAKQLMQKGYIEKLMDSDFVGTAYFASFTKKGERVLKNLWDEWMDLAYEGVEFDQDVILEGVADTILNQLGGRRRLQAFIGARDIFSDDGGKSLVFKFPNRKKTAPNYVKIKYTSMDLYDLEFGRITMKKDKDGFGVKMPSYKKLKTIKGVYNDQLVDIFERTTGLYLHF